MKLEYEEYFSFFLVGRSGQVIADFLYAGYGEYSIPKKVKNQNNSLATTT